MEAWVKNGKRIEVYKHYETRMHIHLYPDGRLIGARTFNTWRKKFDRLPIREIGRGRPPARSAGS